MNKKIFGIECLGCGTQRAFYLILDGHFLDAFYTYPPIYTLLLFFLFILLHFVDKKRNYTTLIKWLAIINGVIMIVSYLIKITNS